MLDVSFVGLDQVALKLHQLLLQLRNKYPKDFGLVVAIYLEYIFVFILVMNEFWNNNGGQNLLVRRGPGHRKLKFHVVYTQNLALSLGNITIPRNRNYIVKNKL